MQEFSHYKNWGEFKSRKEQECEITKKDKPFKITINSLNFINIILGVEQDNVIIIGFCRYPKESVRFPKFQQLIH